MRWPCFLLEPTEFLRVSYRRYSRVHTCQNDWCHNAAVVVGQSRKTEEHFDGEVRDWFKQDPRWPQKCEHCEYVFTDDDHWQLFPETIYKRADTGVLVVLREAPIGAIWFADWMVREGSTQWAGPDGRCMCVKVPNDNEGKVAWDWLVHSRASNCDSPCQRCGKQYRNHPGPCDEAAGYKDDGSNSYVDAHPHKCWVRHGTPPNIHVDKNGVTCGAGAGSIQTPGWHGHLHNGVLFTC